VTAERLFGFINIDDLERPNGRAIRMIVVRRLSFVYCNCVNVSETNKRSLLLVAFLYIETQTQASIMNHRYIQRGGELTVFEIFFKLNNTKTIKLASTAWSTGCPCPSASTTARVYILASGWLVGRVQAETSLLI